METDRQRKRGSDDNLCMTGECRLNSEGHEHDVSIHSHIHLNKTFLRISPARKTAQT